MIEVFFDGKCGLCSKEIAYYQSIAPSGVFVWRILRLTHHRWRRIKSRKLMLCVISMLGMQQVAGILVLRPFGNLAAAALLAFLAVLVGLPIIRQIAAMVYNRLPIIVSPSLPIARLPKKFGRSTNKLSIEGSSCGGSRC